MTRRRSSLALRISLLAVAASVITAVIAGTLSVRLVQNATETSARKTLGRIADEAATAPARTRLALRSVKVNFGTVSDNGTVISTSPLVQSALTPAEIATLVQGGSISARRVVRNQLVLIEARPVRTGGIVLVQRRSDAVAVGTGAIRRLLVALLVAVGVAVLLGLLVSWRLARPLRRTAAAAHALAAGHRDVTVEPQGPAELAEVAEALNGLSAALARSEARQREFLLSVSHDLRTPLTAISGYAESLADGVVTGDAVPRIGSVMAGEADRLGRMVSDLLDLARLDADDVRIDITPVDVAGLVDATVAAWSRRCTEAGVLLYAERPAGALMVGTDPGRLRQVLDGLIENALRVTPAGRPIVVAARAEPGQVVAEVRDGGPGLTDADIAVAFERSALYDRYRGVRRVGTGLGLAIVHRLARRLGGAVEAGHAREGGALFTVRLPAGPNTTLTSA